MGEQEAFERILASLYDAMLDDACWPATAALIDDACGLANNSLLVGDGPRATSGSGAGVGGPSPPGGVGGQRAAGPGGPASGGSMLLRRSPVLPPFVVHAKPVGIPRPDYGARHVAALVRIVEPGRQHRVNPDVVARTLELTSTERQVAVWLAEGKSVRDMAEATGRTEGRHPLAPAPDLREAVHLAAGGSGAVGAVARAVRVSGSPGGAMSGGGCSGGRARVRCRKPRPGLPRDLLT